MKFYLSIIAIAIALYFLLKPAGVIESTEMAATVSQRDVLAIKENRSSDQPKVPVRVPDEADQPKRVSNSDIADGLARANMGTMLKQLSECTEIKNSVSAGTVEPTLTAILDSVQSDLGEPVIRSEDWTSIEIKVADNSKKLIRMESVYEDDDIVKKLKYYQVTPTRMVPIELSREESVNPSESFLASLEKEGEIVGREKSERVFFQNGEEISYIERDGIILSSEIIRAGKSLKCGDFEMKSFRCQCF